MPKGSDWLLPFVAELRRLGDRVVEIGCGPGLDAASLTGHGLSVVAFDRQTLDRARGIAPRTQLLRADLLHVPFRDGSFDEAVSSLALHYLPWKETRMAFAEIRRLLPAGAPFLFRVNATDDFHHGAGQGEQVEPGFYRVPAGTAHHAETKRFLDEDMVRAAVAGMFEVRHVAHITIHRYEQPKRVWECLARAF